MRTADPIETMTQRRSVNLRDSVRSPAARTGSTPIIMPTAPPSDRPLAPSITREGRRLGPENQARTEMRTQHSRAENAKGRDPR